MFSILISSWRNSIDKYEHTNSHFNPVDASLCLSLSHKINLSKHWRVDLETALSTLYLQSTFQLN